MAIRLSCARSMSEVAINLWVGGLPQSTPNKGVNFDALALCIEPYPSLIPSLKFACEPFADDDLSLEATDMAIRLAERVVAWRKDAMKVLVACSYGINRSPFVAALAMMMAGEGTGPEVIAKIRSKRTLPRGGNDHVLSNPSFQSCILSFAP